jgi:hypothetical protein
VPEGQHQVEVRYEPDGRDLGIVISVATAVLLLGLAVVPAVLRRRRRAADPSPH